MGKLHIAFYKASVGALDDKIIDLGSGGLGYSHCEIVIDPQTMIGAHYLAKGVREFKYNNVYESKCWDIVEIDVDSGLKGKEFIKGCIGIPYDLLGVTCSFVGVDRCTDENATWCSKIATEVINTSNKTVIAPNTNLMPNELFHLCTNFLGGRLTKKPLYSHRIKYNPKKLEAKQKITIDRFERTEIKDG